MGSLGDIDKEFATERPDKLHKIPLPVWGKRLIISFILSLLIVCTVKPKVVLDLSVHSDGTVRAKLLKLKAIKVSAMLSLVLYFIVKKFY